MAECDVKAANPQKRKWSPQGQKLVNIVFIIYYFNIIIKCILYTYF